MHVPPHITRFLFGIYHYFVIKNPLTPNRYNVYCKRQPTEMHMPDFSKMTAEQLNDWYEERVGYRPQVDDPTMSEADLMEACLSYWEATTETSDEDLP